MHSADLPLLGRTALVTGVSRRRGIGFATATTLASLTSARMISTTPGAATISTPSAPASGTRSHPER